MFGDNEIYGFHGGEGSDCDLVGSKVFWDHHKRFGELAASIFKAEVMTGDMEVGCTECPVTSCQHFSILFLRDRSGSEMSHEHGPILNS
jgi:hypothetical protein